MPYNDPEKKRAANARWRAEHPDYNWHRDNLEKSKAQSDVYRRNNLTKYAEYQKNSRRRNPQAHLITDARCRAKRAGILCSITHADIAWSTHCPILGVELVYTKGKENFRTNSATLDRRINDLGYVPGNVFVISHRANRLKSDATVAELEAILAYAKGGALTIS